MITITLEALDEKFKGPMALFHWTKLRDHQGKFQAKQLLFNFKYTNKVNTNKRLTTRL